MVFLQNSCSVLLASDSERFNQMILSLLSASGCTPIRVVSSAAAAKRAALEQVFDLVIVNTPLPDDFGTAFSVAQSGNGQTVVLMLVRAALHEEIHSQVMDRGVFTLPKPTTKEALAMALQWMNTTRERLRRVEAGAKTVEQELQELRLLNRAKWLLIEQRGMSESEAHHFLEKQAMDRCISKRRIAEELLGDSDTCFPEADSSPV